MNWKAIIQDIGLKFKREDEALRAIKMYKSFFIII